MTDRITAEWMRWWGAHAVSSPLYSHLVDVVVESDDLMRIINLIENDPPPNLLFGAVQFLLMKGGSQELASYYPSLTNDPRPVVDAGRPFTDFVLANADRVIEIGSTHRTQTNECRRCAALLPGIWEGPLDRFHLVEVGTSAGLNLALDRYRYRWGDLVWGPESSVTIESELRGAEPRLRNIEVLSRTGLDLNPIDANDPDERLWLEALIWPEHHERRARLSAALEMIRDVPIEFVAGDALETLWPSLDSIPGTEPVVVMSAFIGLQLGPDEHEALADTVASFRERREMLHLSVEARVPGEDSAHMVIDDGAGPRQIGRLQSHGEWVELA